jgi:glycosyltransferase involved in cell wall biosynthesis
VDSPEKDRAGMHINRRIQRLRKANRIAKDLKADIYHLHDPELISLGMWLKWTTNAKVIFDCHENNVGYIKQKSHLPKLLSRLALIPMMGFAERRAAKNFDAVITADRGVFELFDKTYGGKRTVLLHNFPRLDLFLHDGVNAPNDWPEVDLVYHGTIPKYHLEVAFEIAEILKQRGRDVKWLFFGVPSAKEAWWTSELKRRDLVDSFIIDPHRIPHQEVACRVKKSRLGFIPLPDLPKFQSNIPTKLFEFMALKMPTVLSDLPPSRPFVGDGKAAVMVPPHDYEAYANAIEKLLDDAELCDQMGEHGHRRVVEEYNWEVESQKLIDLYDSLLDVMS